MWQNQLNSKICSINTSNHTVTSRLPGLDFLRTAAIFLVLWDHGIRFLNPLVFDKLSPYTLLDGVDLFFVLSGWLVTGFIYEKLSSDNFNRKDAFKFYVSRWLRTLPAYWLVLVLNIVLLYLHLTPGLLNGNAVFYAVFLQNFHKPLDLFFWESWSLSVEEWFYILFPLCILLFQFVVKNKQMVFLITCLSFILFSFSVRSVYFQVDDSLSADLYFRKLVLCRLDMIAWGSLAYYAWKKGFFSVQNDWLFMTIGFVLWILSESMDNLYFEKVWKFSFSGFSIAIMMPYFSRMSMPMVYLRKLFEGISRISYSLYLVHLGIVAGLMSSLLPDEKGWIVWLIYIVLSFVAATVLYFSVERPFLSWREKWLSKK